MSAVLTADQRHQLGDQYVHVVPPEGGPPSTASEHARLVEWGTSFLEERLPLIEKLVFEAHLLPPGLEIHAGLILPGSTRAFEVIQDGGRRIFRIAADAEGIREAAADALLAYLHQGVYLEEAAALGSDHRLDAADRIDQPRERQPFGDGFDRRAGRRGLFSIADGPDRSKSRRNTWGDLTFYRRLRESLAGRRTPGMGFLAGLFVSGGDDGAILSTGLAAGAARLEWPVHHADGLLPGYTAGGLL